MKAYKGQDFAALRCKCLRQKELFVDPTFSCDGDGIGREYMDILIAHDIKEVLWKRPSEISWRPKFVVDDASRFDVNQGALGDCWFLSALSSLALNPKLLAQVVPNDQSFGDDYAGIFHFRFWVDGGWTDVVIDDRLPCGGNNLLFVHSTERNEFWTALLEKAYAKLRGGSYGKLDGGVILEAFADFTGGIKECFYGKDTPAYMVPKPPHNFFSVLLKAHEKSSLMGCSFTFDRHEGLVKGHAYSVTSVAEVVCPKGRGNIPLIRIRNPWGDSPKYSNEWKGRYSDSSLEWKKISERERKLLGLVVKNDGEFWMHFDDFEQNFFDVEICHLDPAHFQEKDENDWNTHKFQGTWSNHVTARGSKNFLAFAANPQYRLQLENPDDEDGLCTVIVTLTPKNKKAPKRSLGFDVYNMKGLEGSPRPLPWEFFKNKSPTVRYQSAEHQGSYTARIRLLPGIYCIVPHMDVNSSNEDEDFTLRIFTEKKSYVQDYDQVIDYAPEQIKPQVFIDMETDIVIPGTKKIKVDEDKRIREVFLRLAGEDQEIDYAILQTILNELVGRDFLYKFNGFSSDVCRSLLATMDTDVSGQLGFDEFMVLIKNIQLWKHAFKTFDKDGSGLLNTNELRAALNLTVYSVNRNILKILVYRYAKNGEMNIDDFILCAVKLKTMIECFKSKDPKSTGLAIFSKEDFVGHAMYS